ncbi:MAG: DoxX family protein, partial [Chitinophagaceae bacterium]|nr:DoxX family protein [Chitinophagaceae bacterium]
MTQSKSSNYILLAIRVFVGILFIFSGLIKANDPSGLAYKMGEFFEVWAKEEYLPSLMHWFNNYSLELSVLMIAFEIVAGVALIIGYRFKIFSFLILLLTIFFTFLTAYAVFSGKIKECGCFGDCIKLKSFESFMKDIVLLVLIFILFFFRNKVTQWFSFKVATGIILSAFVFSFLIQWYTLKFLPVKDCLAYKIGNNILKEMTPGDDYVPEEVKTILRYKKDGIVKDFDLTNYPWQDSTWEFDSQVNEVIKEAQNEPPIKDFAISNYDGENVTNQILEYKGNLFILFVKDVDEANLSNMNKLKALISDCKSSHIPIIAVSSSNDIQTNQFKEK